MKDYQHGFLQKSDKGIQLVYFIRRTMTDTERRYSQIEKDTLVIKWAKERLRTYLLDAPKFKIVTVIKPLLPMLDKAKAKCRPV